LLGIPEEGQLTMVPDPSVTTHVRIPVGRFEPDAGVTIAVIVVEAPRVGVPAAEMATVTDVLAILRVLLLGELAVR
jgi:hypothetical protein